jgi:hypothetical protein
MNRATLRSVWCAIALVCAMGPAWAADLVGAGNPNDILAVAKGFGSATLEKDSEGDPKISGRINGIKYGIYFYGCTEGKDCTDIQFATGWSGAKVEMSKVNDWNRTKRYGKAYLDKENDPMLELPVNLSYGVSPKNLDSTFEWWGAIVKSFAEDVVAQ